MSNFSLYVLTVLIWGSSWFAISFQLGSVDEMVSIFYRFALAALLLLAFCVLKKKPLRFSLKNHVFLALQGICLFSSNYVLIYYCTAYIATGLVAVIFSTMVALNIINSALFLKRPIKPVVVLGAMFGLSGISLVFGHELLAATQAVDSERIWKGLLLGLVATYFASLGNIISARNQANDIPVLQANALGMFYGSLLLAFVAVALGAEFKMDWSVSYVGSLLYLTFFGSIVAFGAYLSLIGKIGADKAAYTTVLFPVVALLLSTAFEGFEWTWPSLLGVLMVFVGNLIVVGRHALRGFFQDAKKRVYSA